MDEDHKEKIRQASLGENNHFYGKHHSDKTKEIIREKAIERYKTRPGTMAGRSHTEESKRKMSETKKSQPKKPMTEAQKLQLKRAYILETIKSI